MKGKYKPSDQSELLHSVSIYNLLIPSHRAGPDSRKGCFISSQQSQRAKQHNLNTALHRQSSSATAVTLGAVRDLSGCCSLQSLDASWDRNVLPSLETLTLNAETELHLASPILICLVLDRKVLVIQAGEHVTATTLTLLIEQNSLPLCHVFFGCWSECSYS